MIELDSREKSTDSAYFASRMKKACQREKIPLQVTALETGDIRFLTADFDLVLIERKSTDGDLYSSASKRLWDQCLRLIEEADWPILLIDGPIYLTKDGRFRTGRYVTGWQYNQLMHMLLSLQLRGLIVLWVPRKAQTPKEIIDLYEYAQKADHTSVLQTKLKPFPSKPKGLTLREQQLRVLLSITGVGPALAERLLDIYGSVQGVMEAPFKGISLVPGVGPQIAQRICSVLKAPEMPSDATQSKSDGSGSGAVSPYPSR